MCDKDILKGPKPKEQLYPRSVGVRLFYNLKQHAKNEKIAFIDVTTNKSISYKQIFETSVKVAENLKELGYAGKIIGIYSGKQTDYFVPVLAAFYLGSPVVLICDGYSRRELLHSCELTKPTLVFCSNKTYKTLFKLKMDKSMEYLKHIWLIENVTKFSSMLSTDLETFEPLEVEPEEQIATLFFSSGTTGLSKAVANTHSNLNFIYRAFYDADNILSKITNYILCVPFFHVYGFHLAIITILKGNTVKYLDKFNPETFLSAVEKYKFDCLPLIPPLMTFLAKYPGVEKYDLSSLKYIITGAANCSSDLERAVRKRIPNVPSIHQLYGLTETSYAVISTPVDGGLKEGSIGKLNAGLQMKVRNPDTKEQLGVNDIGEICLKSDSVMKGYYRNPEATRDAICEDGWLSTGDLGYFDNDGYVFIINRFKELIKFKGFQVPPAELEGLLIGHPKVMDAAVVGYPDDVVGELATAFIVKKPGEEINPQEIIDFIKGQVSYPKQLHGGVKFVESIPKNQSGKILHRVLRDSLKSKSKI